MKKSELFNWDLNDLIKGMFMTIIAALLAAAYQIIVEVGLDWTAQQYKEVIVAGLLAGITYALKNFFTDGQNRLAGKEIKKRAKVTGKTVR